MGTVTINSVTINNSSSTNSYGPFSGKTTITSVDLGQVPWTSNSMRNAFSNCYYLNTVSNFSPDIKEFYYTFYQCYALNNVSSLPISIINLAHAFDGCSKLATSPVIPNSVTDLSGTFSRCYSLKNAPIIPNSVTELSSTFEHCYNLTIPPVIPNSVSNMRSTFYNTPISTAPELPDSVTNLYYTFANCKSLTTAPSIPASVNHIQRTFYDCSNLKGNIYIEAADIISASECFGNTSEIKNVYIPFNASLGIYTRTYNAFNTAGYNTISTRNGVSIREHPSFKQSGDWWWQENSGYIYKYLSTTTIVNIPATINGKTTKLINVAAIFAPAPGAYSRIPNSVDFNKIEVVGNNLDAALMSSYNLTTVTNINNNVTSMVNCFEGCRLLVTAPTLPTSLTNMVCTFKDCPNLTTPPTIPSTVINMYFAFNRCEKLRTMPSIPEGVVNMYGAFCICGNGQTFSVSNPLPSTLKDVTRLFYVTNVTGNIYIKSNQITVAPVDFCTYNNVRKNVYIPFTNSDGTTSATYNAFLAAGYTTTGTYCNIYLMNYTGLY